MKRKLASIQRIAALEPIEGADKIQLATINGWKVITAIDNGFSVGDLVIYCEIDAFLPVREELEFLRKSSFKNMGLKEGFRIKTMKLRGALSQGLIVPISVLSQKEGGLSVMKYITGPVLWIFPAEDDEQVITVPLEEGTDVTELLGVVKWEVAEVGGYNGCVGCQGKRAGNFPYFIPKTDEERIQNMPKVLTREQNKRFVVTEKLHGTSFTAFVYNDEFGVCSRNFEIEEDDSLYWRMARHYGVEDRLRTMSPYKDVAIQGEIIGEGVNKNYYGIEGHKLHIFSLYFISERRYATPEELIDFLIEVSMEPVPVLDNNFQLPLTVDEMLTYAKGASVYPLQKVREGVVVRSLDEPRISFKAVSNDYLLKEE